MCKFNRTVTLCNKEECKRQGAFQEDSLIRYTEIHLIQNKWGFAEYRLESVVFCVVLLVDLRHKAFAEFVELVPHNPFIIISMNLGALTWGL